MHKTGFINSVKGKIVIASILAFFALFMAWETSKNAFTSVINAFDNISAPNDKLRLVNELSHRVTRLDQVQKSLLVNKPAKYYGFFLETKKLSLKIDTLKHLYANSPRQIKRLNALKKLLQDRDKLFVDYLNVREGLINNKSFSDQVSALNQMVLKSAKQNDSLVTTTEKKTSTTTIYPTDTIVTQEQHTGFLKKLFGRKKPKSEQLATGQPYKVVDEELKVKRDTIALAKQDSLLKGMGKTMQKMEKTQQVKSDLFVKREAVLTRASANVMRQIFTLLKKVEKETLVQTAANNKMAKSAVKNSIERIGTIMLAFFILSALLVYFILRDISRINDYRKKLEVAKDEAEYHGLAKQRFLSNMSHEIRTPLQSIIGYAEMIKQQEHPQRKDIEAIYRSSGHLLQIVNEVLDYNRIISGKFTFVKEIFNLEELLDEVISILFLQAEKKSIAIKTDYDHTVSASLKGDPFRLKQILYNLLGNAIKFTPSGEVILTVRGKQVNDHISYKFDVTDTGVGLSENDIGRIFNEFEQTGNDKQGQAGTGLGLAITRELIVNQGGNIQVKSELGKGSSFIFELNFERDLTQAVTAKQENVAFTLLASGKVWVVDDDSFILELCSRIFDHNQIEYRCFSSPNDILEAPWDDEVKYIFIDMRMPGMSGTELCSLLRKKVPAETMLYALTAQVMPDESASVLQYGFNGLLMKPFKESELVALVKNDSQKIYNENSHPGLNIKALEKMTLGDHNLIAKILIRFAEDSLNDVAELRAGINEHKMDTVLLLTHRIAGRTAQAGASELAKGFRLAELALHQDKKLTDKRTRHLLSLAGKLHELALTTRKLNIKNIIR